MINFIFSGGALGKKKKWVFARSNIAILLKKLHELKWNEYNNFVNSNGMFGAITKYHEDAIFIYLFRRIEDTKRETEKCLVIFQKQQIIVAKIKVREN